MKRSYPASAPIIINENSVSTGLVYKHKNLIDNINFWHKFIITNAGKHKRNVVLRAILDHVHPLDLIPVSYITEKGVSSFLARNCGAAIGKLVKDNLIVPNSDDPLNPFKLHVILKFATTSEFKVDVQKNILAVLAKRYDATTKTLNLTKFCSDTGLSEFCPLSQPKILFFVLHLSKQISPLPEKYNLSSNRIKIINPLEALNKAKGITHLNLGNNLIETIDCLQPLQSFKITDLVLDHNPVCGMYDNTYSYIKDIKQYCPKLEKLDGFDINEAGLPAFRSNFLCNSNCYDIVNQFLQHFFTLYDSRNRKMMENLYHHKAMFSLTSSYIPGQISSASAKLRLYNTCARNLKKLADFSRNTESLFQGGSTIIKIFNQLPLTEHDPFSFKVDAVYSTPICVVINVSGVFRELPHNLLDHERMLGFSRAFVLEKQNSQQEEWCIVNEQLHVYNALTIQTTSSFKQQKHPRSQSIPAAQNPKDKQQLTDAFRIITNMGLEWSKKCLEECNYDLKKALLLFIDLYKLDKIPSEAFLNK